MRECVILSFIHTVGSSAQPVSTALQRLLGKCQLTTSQINGEIQQKDISYLAACFDNVELYVDALELTPGEQTDVRLKKIDSNHLAMIECLKIWKRRKPSQATFRALLEMLVEMKKEAIAAQVLSVLEGEIIVYVITSCVVFECYIANFVSYAHSLPLTLSVSIK